MKEFSVLFVDDDINVLSSLKRGLIDEEYKAFFATGGDKALKIMEENEISVIVSDMRMPGMDGLQLFKIIKEKYPNTVKIVLSGYTQLPQILATINQVDIFKFITKPWDLEEDLIPIIRQAVDYYSYLNEKEKQREALEKRNNVYQNILRATDEKFLQSKSDFTNIRGINEYIFETLKTQEGISNNKDTLNTIQFIEELYLEYLKVLPTNIMDFRPEKLQADVSKWLSNFKMNDRVEIKSESNTSHQLRGNYILIYYLVTTITKQLLPYAKKEKMGLAISFNDGNISILMTISKIDDLSMICYKDSNITSILIPFLKVICKTIDSIMLIQTHDECLTAELKIPVQSI